MSHNNTQFSSNKRGLATRRSCNGSQGRSAFTLVELLVVAVVAGILMSMVMVALRGAQQDANVAKTRATIRKIDAVIQDRYEEYRYAAIDTIISGASLPFGYDTRSLPKQPVFTPTLNDPISGLPESDAKIHSRIRLQLTRDLMRFEMPDCPGDIFTVSGGGFAFRFKPVFSAYYTFGGSPVGAAVDDSARYAQLRTMLAARAIVPGSSPTQLAFNGTIFSNTQFTEQNFNAELLFLIVETSYVAGSFGIEAFSNSEIADTDGDGLREFVDAWRRPIQWLRSPAGYYDDPLISQSQTLRSGVIAELDRYNPDPFAKYYNSGVNTTIDGGDPFDPNKADLGYSGTSGDLPLGTLRPLIVSGGQDGLFGLRFFWTGNNVRSNSTPSPLFSLSDATIRISGTDFLWPDPYHPRQSSRNGYTAGVNQALGGVLNTLVDGDGSETLAVTTGINAGGFVVSAEQVYRESTPALLNQAIRDSVSDNITNFDETGGAL